MTWTESKPKGTDPARELVALVQGQKSALSSGIAKHFYWSDSATSAGEPRLSLNSYGPGSARAFFAAASSVSARHDGALLLTSDTTRCAVLTSVWSAYIGGPGAVLGYSASTMTATQRFAVESGSSVALAGGATIYNQPFTSDFSALPTVTGCCGWSDNTDGYGVSLMTVTVSGFSYQIARYGSASANSATLHWRAEGLRALG